jgi:hypothetical protein
MKRKMHCEVQPGEISPPRSRQVREEIQNFLQALDSYPARAAKEPRVSFHQHLCSIFATRNDRAEDRAEDSAENRANDGRQRRARRQ